MKLFISFYFLYSRPKATGVLTRALGICTRASGRSRKSFIFGVQAGPTGFQTPSTKVGGDALHLSVWVWRPIGPFKPKIFTISGSGLNFGCRCPEPRLVPLSPTDVSYAGLDLWPDFRF